MKKRFCATDGLEKEEFNADKRSLQYISKALPFIAIPSLKCATLYSLLCMYIFLFCLDPEQFLNIISFFQSTRRLYGVSGLEKY